jgi:general secretion pathway protein B
MSSILEALKKLEEEKAARRGGTGNIAGKVTASSRRPRQKAAWLVPVGMAAVAVVAILVTYTLMGGFSPRPAETAAGRRTDQASRTPAISAPPITTPDGSKDQEPPSEPPQVPQQPRSAAPPAADAGPVTTLPHPTPKHTSPPAPSRQEIREETAPSLQPPAAEQHPAISVTGIAWQQNSASRMAVINGSSVTEGAIVEGARVTEILSDRVRLSFKGNAFEIQLEK